MSDCRDRGLQRSRSYLGAGGARPLVEHVVDVSSQPRGVRAHRARRANPAASSTRTTRPRCQLRSVLYTPGVLVVRRDEADEHPPGDLQRQFERLLPLLVEAVRCHDDVIFVAARVRHQVIVMFEPDVPYERDLRTSPVSRINARPDAPQGWPEPEALTRMRG
jgi:hypothetical protein